MRNRKGLVISILLIILFTLNWMYLSESKVKWGGINPVVSFAINPEIIGFKSSKNQNFIVKEIVEASGEWFLKAESKLNFKYAGLSKSKPFSIDEISCDAETRLDLQQGEVLFYPDKGEEEDCSSSSCAYVWSCNGTIVHADVILNNSQFSWSEIGSDADVRNIKFEILKAFGYVAGLGHCNPGDTANECQARTGTDPTSSSVMYKFPQLGKKTTISEDEKLGLQSIYGVQSLPFPKEGKYALTYNELNQIQEYTQLLTVAGSFSDAGRKSFGNNFRSVSAYNFRKTNKTLEAQYDEFISLARSQIPEFTKEELEAQRMFLNQGILSAYLMKEEVDLGYVQLDKAFLDYTIQNHLELRKLTIDALEGK